MPTPLNGLAWGSQRYGAVNGDSGERPARRLPALTIRGPLRPAVVGVMVSEQPEIGSSFPPQIIKTGTPGGRQPWQGYWGLVNPAQPRRNNPLLFGAQVTLLFAPLLRPQRRPQEGSSSAGPTFPVGKSLLELFEQWQGLPGVFGGDGPRLVDGGSGGGAGTG